jgi:hypothetical protein
MWWVPTGAWVGPFLERGRVYPPSWQGPQQVEDKSPANVARAYDYLLRLPYQSAEDRERIEELRFKQILKARARERSP